MPNTDKGVFSELGFCTLSCATPVAACPSFPWLCQSPMCPRQPLCPGNPCRLFREDAPVLILFRSLLFLRRGPVLGDDENAIRGSQHLKWVVREKRHRCLC